MDSIRSVGAETNTNIARSFLRLTSLDNQIFERLGRYETNLWRQIAQILLLLSAIEFRAKDHLPDGRPFLGKLREVTAPIFLPLVLGDPFAVVNYKKALPSDCIRLSASSMRASVGSHSSQAVALRWGETGRRTIRRRHHGQKRT